MPQAALGRCNCTPCGPPWILDQNETFGVKPQNTPQIGQIEHGHCFKKARKQAINPAISRLNDVHALSGVKFPKH